MNVANTARHALLIGTVVGAAVAAYLLPPIPQPASYHAFADTRTLFAIPNSLNVISNLPFAFVGIAGVMALLRRRATFIEPWERWPYAALFLGVACTTFGSSYYHWAPDNARLVWDRLPMAIGFMALLTAVIGERVSRRVARLLFIPLLAFGVASVVVWHWSELRGAGDLRLYGVAQFGSLALILLMLVFYPGRYSDGHYLFGGLCLYAVAKAFELADRQIYDATQIISGHSIKHVSAACGVAVLAIMIRRRDATMRPATL